MGKKIVAAEFVDLNFLDSVDVELQKTFQDIGRVKGSDAHEKSRLGANTSWIKMGKPTIDGLRLALYDNKFCVSNEIDDPNSLPNLSINNLTIKKMTHCGIIPGKPVEIKLHPLFNAIIGGRGAGKSTFVESLRIAMGRSEELVGLQSIKRELDSFIDGVTRDDTEISVGIKRRDDLFNVIWTKNNNIEIKKFENEEWQDAPGKPEERFNISIYSQKQINALASNPESLLNIVDRTPQVDISSWKQKLASQQVTSINLAKSIRKIELSALEKTSIQAQIDDLNSDISSFEKGGHKDVFNNYQTLSKKQTKIEDSFQIESLSNALQSIIDFNTVPLDLSNLGHELENENEVSEIHKNFTTEIDKVISDIKSSKAKIDNIVQQTVQALDNSEWKKNSKKIIDRYKEVVQAYESKGHELNPQEYEQWIEKRNNIQKQLDEIVEEENKLESYKTDFNRSISLSYILRRRLQKKREKFIRSVIGNNKYVKMSIIPFGDKNNIENDFRSILGYSNGFNSSIYQDDREDSLLYKVINDGGDLRKTIKYISEIKDTIFKIAEGEDVTIHRVDGRFKTSLCEKIKSQPEILERIINWLPQDRLLVEYARDVEKGKFASIDRGSAGQKAAAILAFLLSHGDNPIVVDQPEDDLDNALINKLIVSQIHSNKRRRQIIIITHNPNIVVNGDAEYINVMHFNGGQVQLLSAGGLCDTDVRLNVCEIMEGGKEAFNLRYNRLLKM
ncbi:TrlF family AAA-like ATPase [Enterobacter ludwigii]|uniref:TrlF family AAA-like ATPase n=1 Tax=Enterobacter ludwigii TaxID=299767 RepID=UPI003ED8CC98